jgi:hypothetical protein
MQSMTTVRSIRSGSTLRGALLALATTVIAVFALQSPSMADENYHSSCAEASVSCQNGVEVAGPQGECKTAGSGYASTIVCVDYSGDFVYVKDNKPDSRSALGYVTSQDGSVTARICRNAHGNDSWARCNFDWAESGKKWVEGGYLSNPLTLQQLWNFTGK